MLCVYVLLYDWFFKPLLRIMHGNIFILYLLESVKKEMGFEKKTGSEMSVYLAAVRQRVCVLGVNCFDQHARDVISLLMVAMAMQVLRGSTVESK